MKTVLMKAAIVLLMLTAALMAVLFFVFDNDANALLWLAERAAMCAVAYGSYRLAEKIYKARLATGGK